MNVKRRNFLFGLGALAAAGASRADAQFPFRTQTYDLGHQGALYRVMLDVGGGRRCMCTAAVLPRRSFAASIVDHPEREGAMTAVADVAHKTDAVVAINGASFNGAFAPDGLLVVNGKTIGKKRADWKGYVVIDGDGNLSVTASPRLRTAKDALQGYPMIVEPGGKIGIWRDDHKRAGRSVIAQSGDLVIAMVTSPVTLFELAYALVESPGQLFLTGIDAAVNLSGSATTSFYARTADRQEITVSASWPNREVIAFTARS